MESPSKSSTTHSSYPMNTTLLRNPIFLLILGAGLISFSGVWVKLADVTPSSSAFYRVFFGFFFLLILSLPAKKYKIPQGYNVLLATLCALFFALDLLCWHTSIVLIGPGLATLLGNFQVFILAGVGILVFKEKWSTALILSIPLALTGLGLIIGQDWSTMTGSYKKGIYFGLATALFYSAYLLSLRFLSGSTTNKYFPMMFVSLLSSVILGYYISRTADTFAIPNLKSFFSLAALGLLSQCLGWLLIAASLPKCRASSAGLILLLQPSLAFIWDVLFFSRPTDLLNWVGVALTLFSIYLGMSARQKKT